MLLEARHELDQVAGPQPRVELVVQDALPGVAAGARRARQGEQVGAVRDPAEGPALHGRDLEPPLAILILASTY